MKRKAVALVDEPRCIGCTLCIEACPVDAIAGARGFLHTVIADYCIGCELCIAPCPVDCIAMVPASRPWTAADAAAAKQRARFRKGRITSEIKSKTSKAQRLAVLAAILKK